MRAKKETIFTHKDKENTKANLLSKRFQQIFKCKVAGRLETDFTMWRKLQQNIWVGSVRRESICPGNPRNLVFGRIQYNIQCRKDKNEAQRLLRNLNAFSVTHTTDISPYQWLKVNSGHNVNFWQIPGTIRGRHEKQK